jgi:hypothetical protein
VAAGPEAGGFADIATAIAATRPATTRTYTPDRGAGAGYDAVYEIYRGLYETLGRTEVRLLHNLKRTSRQAGELARATVSADRKETLP